MVDSSGILGTGQVEAIEEKSREKLVTRRKRQD